MAQQQLVRIVSWPDPSVRLEHRFDAEEACPVSIRFGKAPARVELATAAQRSVDVDMRMAVAVRRVVPVCIKVCEPLCARSDYALGVSVFEQPVAAVDVRGETRLYNCREKPSDARPGLYEARVDFSDLKSGLVFTEPIVHRGLLISPIGDPLTAEDFGQPAGRTKLRFPPSGVRIELPRQSEGVLLAVNGCAEPALKLKVFSGTTLVNQLEAFAAQAAQTVSIPNAAVTAIEIRGGGGEASLVEICYRPFF